MGKKKTVKGSKAAKAAPASSAAGFVAGQRVKVLAGDYGNSCGAVVSVGGDKAAVLLDNNRTRGPVDFFHSNLAAL